MYLSFSPQEYILRQVASMYLKLGWPTNNLNKLLIQASYQHEYCFFICLFGFFKIIIIVCLQDVVVIMHSLKICFHL